MREEEEREARNAVKLEQDLAFEMAQKADREKEEAKRREAEERLEQAKIEEAVRRSEEEAKVRKSSTLLITRIDPTATIDRLSF